MKEKVGIGIIGTGFARRIQIPAFLACENARIVSVASGHIDNARATAKEFGTGHATADWNETVSHTDVDLVCITTPPPLHLPITLAAIAAGKHVLCEKPMAMNVSEEEQMTDAAAGSSLVTLIDHELRFQPGRLRAYQMLRDGAIGKVRHAKAIFQAPHRGDPDLPWNWWSDAGAGGGALGAIASHVIDTFLWFLNTDISSVFCQLQTHIKQRRDASGMTKTVTSDDESNMLLRFGHGELVSDATGLVSISMTELPRYMNRTEFYGENGSIRIDQLGELYVAKRGETDWTQVEINLGTPVPGVADTGFSRGFMAFAPLITNAIAKGENYLEHGATFADGLKTQHVLDAAVRSNLSGRSQKLLPP
jgi:predicted dehydrogenase